MKSNRRSITLIYTNTINNNGVATTTTIKKVVKALNLKVFQKRLNEAEADGLKINGRVRVRSMYNADNLNYVKIKDNLYKINNIYDTLSTHFIEIEIGEMI